MTLILAWKVKYFLPTVFISDWMFLGQEQSQRGGESEAEQHSDTPLAILAVVRKQQNIGSANHVDSASFWLFEGDVEEVYETSKKLVDNPRLELMKVSSHTKHFTQFLLLF